MRIGVPKEIKTHEYRVALVPESVAALAARGHAVLVESGAGAGCGYDDDAFRKAGAAIAADAEAVFAAADMVVKVKEPQEAEWRQLRAGQILFTYLHLAADPAQCRGLMQSGVTAIAYETVTDAAGRLPLLAPMSVVAGRLAVTESATHLKRNCGGRGVLLAGAPGAAPGRVLVIGGGVVGSNAAQIALGLGAEVIILDRDPARLKELEAMFAAQSGGRLQTRESNDAVIGDELSRADLVIGAVLVPGAAAPKLVRRDHLGLMLKGAVLCDVAIDQGGCFATSRPTTHDDPVYEMDGILHYCVANIPGAVPLTASLALNHATMPFVMALADKGEAAMEDDPHLKAGLNIRAGEIIHPAIPAIQ